MAQHPMLNTAIKAARRAGNIIVRASRDLDLVKVENKRHNDFVTEVDKAAESAIIDVLLGAYPDHAILAEESGASANTEAPYRWIIDPLDGTTNFIHGVPQFAVSIALEHNGVLQQAVVFDPSRNELFTATRGGGAFCNDRRLRVSKRLRLNECLIGTGFPFRNVQQLDDYIRTFSLITTKTAGIRRPGAAALDLAYVAAGRFDGFWERELNAWDIAAGALLITEAGGLITNFHGRNDTAEDVLESGDVVAATPKIFPQLLALVQEGYRLDAKPSSTAKLARATRPAKTVKP